MNYLKTLTFIGAIMLAFGINGYAQTNQSLCEGEDLEKNCELSSFSVNGHSFWLPGLPGVTKDFHFLPGSGSFKELAGGKAKVKGTIVNENDPTQMWTVMLCLSNKSDWNAWSANGGDYKDEQGVVTDEYKDWDYYIIDTNANSKLTGAGSLAGSWLLLTHMPSNFQYGFQAGKNANSKNTEYGMACWFYYNGKLNGQAVSGHGDVNVNSSCSPGVTVTGGDIITCDQPAVTINASSDYPNVSYSWSGPNGFSSNSASPSVSVGGTYVVIASSMAGCTSKGKIYVTKNTVKPTISGTVTEPTCNGDLDGSIDITASGTTSPYTYSWSNGANTEDLANIGKGNYKVTVTGSNGCWRAAPFKIRDLEFYATTKATRVSCYGGADGTITTTVKNGNAPFSYAWSNGATSANPTGLAAGKYTVTVTDNNGCTTTKVATVPDGKKLSVAFTSSPAKCTNPYGYIKAKVAGTHLPRVQSFLWNTGETTSMIDSLSGGTYTLTISYDNGCEVVESWTHAPLGCCNVTSAGKIGSAQTGCGEFDPAPITSITDPSGGVGTIEYVWLQREPGQPYSQIAGANGPTYDPGIITTTMQYRRCARRSGCSAFVGESNWVTMKVIEAPTVEITSENGTCENNLLGSATASGGAWFAWSNGATTASINGLTPGTYTVTVTKGNGCSASESVNITAVECCNVTSAGEIGFDQENCGGFDPGLITSLSLPSGGLGTIEYVWLQREPGQAYSQISGANGPEYDPGYISTTMQYRRCARRSGCTAFVGESNWVTMTVSNEAPEVNIIATNGECDGSLGTLTANATGTGPFTYTWSLGSASGSSVINLVSGVYSVTVSNGYGCTATASATISNNEPAEVDVDVENGTCDNNNLGTAEATGASTYAWSNGATTATVTNLAAGIYTVTATNEFGCTVTEEVEVEVVECCNVTSSGEIGTDQQNCGGFDPAPITSISLPSGGVGTIEYVWLERQPGQAFSQISGANGPTYDPGFISTSMQYRRCARRSGCVSFVGESNWVTMTVLDEVPEISLVVENGECDGGLGTITASATGNGPFTYTWSAGMQNGQQITNLVSGIYTVIVSNANGCTSSASATIENAMPAEVSVEVENGTCSNNNVGTLTASGASTYAWSTGESSATISNLAAGTYTVTATNSYGCTAIAEVGVEVVECCNVTSSGVIASNQEHCGGFDPEEITSVSLPSGGVGTIEYVWLQRQPEQPYSQIAGANGPTYDPGFISTTMQYRRCARRSGCTAFVGESNWVTMEVIEVPEVTLSVENGGCNGGLGSITAAVSGQGSFMYSWSSGQSTAQASNLQSGTYTVTVTNEGGCSTEAQATIENAVAANVTVTTENGTCENGNLGSATASGSESYAWSTGATTASITGLAAGVYTVTATNEFGCTVTDEVEIDVVGCCNVTSAGVIGSAQENCGGFDPSPLTSISLPAGGLGTIEYVWLQREPGQAYSQISGANGPSYDPGYISTTMQYRRCARRSGCTSFVGESNWVTITVNDIPTASITSENGTCSNNMLGSATASGGSSYSWSNGATSATITGLAPGTYTVTVSNASGCTDTEEVTITSVECCNVTSAGAIGNGQTSCGGFDPDAITSVSLPSGGVGNIEYVWLQREPGQSYSAISGANGPTYDPGFISTTMEYRRCARRSGCTSYVGESNWITMKVLDVPEYSTKFKINSGSWTYDSTVTVCQGQKLYLGIYPNQFGSISWAGPQGFTSSNSHPLVSSCVQPSHAGTYTVTATGENGCTTTKTIEVNVENCCGEILALKIYDQSTDEEVAGIGAITEGMTISEASLPSNYYLAVEVSSSIESVKILVDGNTQSIENVIPYTWPNGAQNGGNWNGGEGTFNVVAKAYTEDNASSAICDEIDITFSIEDACDNLTSAGEIGNAQSNCGGFDPEMITSVNLPTGGSGTIEYVWLQRYPGQSYSAISGANGPTYDPGYISQTTEYRRCARRNGCSAYVGESNWITMTVNDNCLNPPTAPSCASGNFLWENEIDVTSLSGSYGIPDADLRMKGGGVTVYTIPGPYPSAFNSYVTISVDEAISWDAYLGRPNTGSQPNEQWRIVFKKNGSVVHSTGYTGDLETGTVAAEWIGSLGSNIELPTGTDEILIVHYENSTYGSGSAPSANSVVPVSVCFSYEAGCDNVTDGGQIGNEQSACEGFDPETITNVTLPSGGSGNLEYQWFSRTNNQSPVAISGATNATYDPGFITETTDYMRKSKRDGCDEFVGETDWITMTVGSDLSVDLTTTNPACAGSGGMIEAMAFGGNGMPTYSWSNGSTMSIQTGLGSGTYIVTVTDGNGCTVSDSAEISIPEPLALSFVATPQSYPGAGNGTLQANVTGGTPAYSYQWETGATGQTLTGVTYGWFNVTVTDANGCMIADSGYVMPGGVGKTGRNQSTDISEITEVEMVTYPNPMVKGQQLTVNVSGIVVEETSELLVFDITGQLLINQKVSLLTGFNTLNVDGVDRLPAGAYIVQLNVCDESIMKRIQVSN